MAVSNKKNETSVKTLLGDLNDLESRFPGTYPIYPQTTLNFIYQKFHNETDIAVAPPIQYFGLGIGGFHNIGDQNQGAPYQPSTAELDLYFPIPLRCVPYDQDLSTAERNNYRMRVLYTNENGQKFWCYYLKPIKLKDQSSRIVRIDPITHTETPYEFSQEQLRPKPVIPETSGEQSSARTEIQVYKRIEINWYGSEIFEVINNMFDGNLLLAKISEIGIYTGVDRQVNGYDHNNQPFVYTESIYVQLAYKICNTGSTITSNSYDGSRTFTFANGTLLQEDGPVVI